jgi:hypothetical protein
VPASWVSFLIFICFVAPGFYFEQISRTRRVRAKESAFQEISRTVLGSVAISIPAGLAAFVTWGVVTGGQRPDFAALLRWENSYVGSHFGSLLASALGYLAASFGVATLANHVLSRQSVTPLVHKHTLWTELFRVKKRPEREAVVMVVMKSGDTWQGIVGNFSADHETDDRELVLYGPILHRSTVHDKPVLQQQDVLVLRGSEISSIGINYTLKTEEEPDRSYATDAAPSFERARKLIVRAVNAVKRNIRGWVPR